ncbi:hypothetical protein EDD63_1762 [Breznakia blatticola]|uniref:Uncharacterized protein n=1 Tax=Breznakia blatticola TaxID=1754012 RepID=A0A4R7ZF91_9FIRM|nr:hypothetical protein [Breznakia blatticola]TDW08052.1 hypothetical protein EDD63_1762 [Breznakia blatticola]
MNEHILTYKRNLKIDISITFVFVILGLILHDEFYYLMGILSLAIALSNLFRLLKLRK